MQISFNTATLSVWTATGRVCVNWLDVLDASSFLVTPAGRSAASLRVECFCCTSAAPLNWECNVTESGSLMLVDLPGRHD